MKTNTSVSYDSLVYVLKSMASNKTAAFAARKLLKQHGLSAGLRGKRDADAHQQKHGENGSENAQKLVAGLGKYTLPQLEEWLRLATVRRQAQETLWQAQFALETADMNLRGWVSNPLTAQEAYNAMVKEGACICADVEAEEENGATKTLPKSWSIESGRVCNQFGDEV